VIARIFIFILLAIALPDVYLYFRYIRKRGEWSVCLRVLWWIPGIVLTAYALGLSFVRDFVPANMVWVNVYLFMFGLVVVPKLLFVICSLVGRLLVRAFRWRKNWGSHVGLVLSSLAVCAIVYGAMIGVKQFTVKYVDLYFDDLPNTFDGYRMALFTDVHAGSVDPQLLEKVVEEINSLAADAVLFAGDLQNVRPNELDGYARLLRSVRGKDGVFSVLGNHDYSMYVDATQQEKVSMEQELINRERGYGWSLLLNSHRVVRRGSDSIVIAGEENDGKIPFPQRADLAKTLKGVSPHSFVALLQHDPSAWRKCILPKSSVQLTLSGHTHGGQVNLFGLRPTRIVNAEDAGLYRSGDRFLYVSTGVGGLVPFRLGVPPEIVVIELHKNKPKTNQE